jgi:L-threonylcarbamoyladenylate synthase
MRFNQPSGWHIRLASRAIAQGGVIAYPTEAVWGLGCAPAASAAVERILHMKKRPARLGLILIGARIEQLQPFMGSLTDDILQRLEASWPGPVTWIVPAAPNVSPLITGGRATIAVRVTAHPVASALCAAADTALISTSANVSGHLPARTALAVRQRFGHDIDCLVPGEVGGLARPTTIRDALTGRMLRAG